MRWFRARKMIQGISSCTQIYTCTNLSTCTRISRPARNIPGIFAECSLNVVMFRASREHLGHILEENIFSKFISGKVVFALKVYDLTITNVDFLVNSSNHKAMFLEYSKNIPRISVSKMFQGYSRNIAKLWKYFYEVKKFKKLFCGLSCENFKIASLLFHIVFLNCIGTVFQLEKCFEKFCINAWQLVKI